MSRKINQIFAPHFVTPFPFLTEPVLPLDREPLRTRLDFTSHKEDRPMNKVDFVIHCIRHSEFFPDVGEITLDTARSVVENLAPDERIPQMTADEFMNTWNAFVHNPKVMDPNS